MEVSRTAWLRGCRCVAAGNGIWFGQIVWHQRRARQYQDAPRSHDMSLQGPSSPSSSASFSSDTATDSTSSSNRSTGPTSTSPTSTPQTASSLSSSLSSSSSSSSSPSINGSGTSFKSPDRSSQALPLGWDDDPNMNITAFSELPHKEFGYNQHLLINAEFKESLRQIIWQFRAPIRYVFAYGSGVFSQGSTGKSKYSDGDVSSVDLSPHPRPPEAIAKWQNSGGKMIDFIFGVSYTQHWHSLNLSQHRDHYSFLGSLGSGLVSRVQESWPGGAGVYFNPYITVNGTLIKYGVTTLDNICRDLSQWQTLYLAGRLQKPVKILRDDARVRLANQLNLLSAVRTALLLLPPEFSEVDLYATIAGLSYMGDPRTRLGSAFEHPRKVANIVAVQIPAFRQLYLPLIENLPNLDYDDSRCSRADWSANLEPAADDGSRPLTMVQDMDVQKRANMVRRLPHAFRSRLYEICQRTLHLSPEELADVMMDTTNSSTSTSTSTSGSGSGSNSNGGENGSTGSDIMRRRHGGPFDRRIVSQPDLNQKIRQAVRTTVSWPSASQSIMGLFTAGFSRTWRYLREKLDKGRARTK